MAAHMNIAKARTLMKKHQLDALVACSPANFFYVTGVSSMLAWLYRDAALNLAFIPADETIEPAIFLPAFEVESARQHTPGHDVQGIPVWFRPLASPERARVMEMLNGSGIALPEQYEPAHTAQLLADCLDSRSHSQARIGIDLEFVSAATFALLRQASPEVEWVDATALFYELRAVKTNPEIAAIRAASAIAAAAVTCASRGISRSSTLASLKQALVVSAYPAAEALGVAEEYIAIDGQCELGHGDPCSLNYKTLPDGAIIKFDVQANVSHYYGDLGRSFVIGRRSAEQERIWNALVAAHHQALSVMRPGVPIKTAYAAAREALDQAGLSGFSRGQFGHSVGLDAKIEEPPFISPTCERCFEPGMVFALEVPLPVWGGIGPLHLEDMCLITDEGCEVLAELPYDLRVIEA